jgi:hypothetical protein
MELYTFLRGYKLKIERDHRTKNFKDFIEQHNFSVYDEMKIEIQFEREGKGEWLAFALKDDQKMFETEIAERRKDAHKTDSFS